MFIGIYNSLIRVLYPLVIKRYINKRKENGKEDISRFHERLGRPQKPRKDGKLIWMHGASVGESLSMLPLINRLLEQYPDLEIMVTTGTVTSADLMSKRLPERAFHQYIPIDHPSFVRRFLKHWHPDLVLWFESEFWPALLSGIKKRNIPLILVNGRISNKSFKRWQQFDYISKELLEEAQRMPYGLLRSLFVCPSLKKWQEEPLCRLREDLAQIRKRAPYEALRYIRNVTGYDEYLQDYASYRKANLPHFLEIADEITETAKDTDSVSSFEKRLEEMSRQMQEQQKTPQGPAVSLTTIHSAKGLEFTAVFLPSLAEGILPYEKSREGAALEEERRLFYVGLTRARRRLFLSFCEKRYERQMKPSRFLEEMGLPAHVFLKENDKKS